MRKELLAHLVKMLQENVLADQTLLEIDVINVVMVSLASQIVKVIPLNLCK